MKTHTAKLAGLFWFLLSVWVMGMTPVAADPIFDSMGITNPVYPTPHISARADWSSDLGADYQFELKGDQNNSSNPVFGVGQGSFTSSDPGLTPYDSGFDLHYALDSRGGGAGDTYSEGWLSVPDSGPVDPNQVFEFRLRNVLGENDPGLGISTEAEILTNFYFGNVTPADTLYYAIDWSGSLISSGQTDALVMVAGIGGPGNVDPRRPVVGEFTSNQHDITTDTFGTGVYLFSGSDYGTLGSNSVFGIDFWTYLDDVAGIAGAGTQDFTVRVAFSTSAITSVPSQGVPEPGSLMDLMLGIAGIGLIRWRRRVPQRHTA